MQSGPPEPFWPKDLEFCRALGDAGLVDGDRLRDRLAKVESLDQRVRSVVAARIPS